MSAAMMQVGYVGANLDFASFAVPAPKTRFGVRLA